MSRIPVIEMKGASKAISGNKVLENVAFELVPGEIHTLMGENGAGKSTLVKILTGIYERDAGKVFVKGQEVHFKNPKEAEQAGIAVIHQELNIIPYLTVYDNMFLGKELTVGRLGITNDKEMKKKTKEFLNRLGIHIDPITEAGNLSVGQQQMIEIARAVAANIEVLIMDEPTAALTDREIEALFKVISTLKAEGAGLFISRTEWKKSFKSVTEFLFCVMGNLSECSIIGFGEIKVALNSYSVLNARG
jgi:ribose transport system ATP-binding protein